MWNKTNHSNSRSAVSPFYQWSIGFSQHHYCWCFVDSDKTRLSTTALRLSWRKFQTPLFTFRQYCRRFDSMPMFSFCDFLRFSNSSSMAIRIPAEDSCPTTIRSTPKIVHLNFPDASVRFVTCYAPVTTRWRFDKFVRCIQRQGNEEWHTLRLLDIELTYSCCVFNTAVVVSRISFAWYTTFLVNLTQKKGRRSVKIC